MGNKWYVERLQAPTIQYYLLMDCRGEPIGRFTDEGAAQHIADMHNRTIEQESPAKKVQRLAPMTKEYCKILGANPITSPLEDRVVMLEERLGHHMDAVDNRFTTVTLERERDVQALRERMAELEIRADDRGKADNQNRWLSAHDERIDRLEHRFINHNHQYSRSGVGLERHDARTGTPEDDDEG